MITKLTKGKSVTRETAAGMDHKAVVVKLDRDGLTYWKKGEREKYFLPHIPAFKEAMQRDFEAQARDRAKARVKA